MGRVRMINPEVFLHESLGGCSAHARLLFIALWTQADREGRLRWLPLRIHGEAFPHEPDLMIDALAAELVEAKVLIVYLMKGRKYAALPGFPRWQRPHKNEAESRCPPPPSDGEPLVGQGSASGPPDTDNGERITENDLRRTDLDSSNEESSSGRRRDADPEVSVPTGDECLDYLLETWPGLLGKTSTLPRWIKTSRAAFPAVDILAEARKAAAWELSQPSRKKRQVRAFLTKWGGRSQDRGGTSPPSGTTIEAEALAVARGLGATL